MNTLIFEWDDLKSRSNKQKHGVCFETAVHVFDDPFLISVQDRHVDGEERWQSIGMVQGCLVLLVAHLFWEEDGQINIRIISARKATSGERRRYEKKI